MATFEEVVDKTKAAANTVAKKSQEAYNITKKKIALSETKRKIKKNFADLGELYYNSVVESTEIAVQSAAIIDEITMLKSEAEEIESEILILQDAVSCPKCGAKNAKDNVFCSKCGEKL